MPKVVVIAGPTASGKSKLAIDFALSENGVVINADASQVYGGIGVIAAAPDAGDKAVVPHLLYEYLDDSVHGNVVNWLDDAVKAIKSVWAEGKTPVVVGGSGMYIDNLINGTTPIPEIDPQIRQQVADMDNIYDRLDPGAAAMLNRNDTTRVRRAMEIWLQTGVSVAEWYKKPMLKRLSAAEFFVIKLLPPKPVLDERCDLRFDQMIANGAIDEVRLLAQKKLPANWPVMKAQGVPELIKYANGGIGLAEAVAVAKTHTRQYAKRQITWFKNKLDADITLDECYPGQNNLLQKCVECYRKK